MIRSTSHIGDALVLAAVEHVMRTEGGDAAAIAARDRWLGADVARRVAFTEALAAWHALRAFPFEEHAHLPRRAAHDRRTVDATSHAVRKRGRVATAAGFVCGALVFFAVLFQSTLVRWLADDATRPGEQKTIVLDDGSRLTLSTDTAVDLAFDDTCRRIELRRGTVFADVAHDASRPFEVAVGPLVATAVGTRFAVAREGGDAVVSMEEGVVTVRADRQPLQRIGAGERYDSRTGRVTPDATDALAWRDGRLIFDDVALEDAVAQVGRYVEGIEMVTGECVGRVSGVVLLDDPAAALDTLAHRHGCHVRHVPGLTVLTR